MTAGPTRSKLALGVGIAVGGACLVLFLSRVDTTAVGGVILAADPALVLASILLQVPLYLAKAVRWRLLLPGGSGIAFRDLWDGICMGFGANTVLPGRAGELVRAATLNRLARVPLGHGLASLLVERLSDLATLAFFLGASAAAIGSTTPALARMRAAGSLVAAVALLGLPVLVLLGRRPGALQALAAPLVGFLPERLRDPANGFLANLAEGLATLGSVASTMKLVVLSLFHWSISLAGIHVAARSVGLDLGPSACGLTLGAIAFAVALPQAPGFLGPFQLACSETLTALGHPRDMAAAFAILLWVAGTLPTLFMGASTLLLRGSELGGLLVPARPGDPTSVSGPPP